MLGCFSFRKQSLYLSFSLTFSSHLYPCSLFSPGQKLAFFFPRAGQRNQNYVLLSLCLGAGLAIRNFSDTPCLTADSKASISERVCPTPRRKECCTERLGRFGRDRPCWVSLLNLSVLGNVLFVHSHLYMVVHASIIPM